MDVSSNKTSAAEKRGSTAGMLSPQPVKAWTGPARSVRHDEAIPEWKLQCLLADFGAPPAMMGSFICF
ncbi:hypothetical protein FCM35_KLT05715 [Carex littledalei]|uniref:Uncharacterized protein n=1 Tax=Carex littledalei TaxID=544730 RepID=A0A833QYD8_9POAL|nr:hypothetical protein FCM35_KLT05715 [Carex littledalei]